MFVLHRRLHPFLAEVKDLSFGHGFFQPLRSRFVESGVTEAVSPDAAALKGHMNGWPNLISE